MNFNFKKIFKLSNRKTKNIIVIVLASVLFACNDNRNSEKIKNDIKIALIEKDYRNAYDDVMLLIEHDSTNGELFYFKALTEINENKRKDALISLQKSIQFSPNFSKSYIERAKLKLKLGDYIACISDCDKAKLIEKENSEIYITEAAAYDSLDDNANAMRCYETAIKYNSKEGEIFYNLAVMQIKNGLMNKACPNLSLAGEKGYVNAYELIKLYCNNINNLEIDSDILNNSVNEKTFPGKFSITFPKGWEINEKTNKDQPDYVIGANRNGARIGVSEMDYAKIGVNNNIKSAHEINSENYIKTMSENYPDFKCYNIDKKKHNGLDALIIVCSYSLTDPNTNKLISAGQTLGWILNQKTKKVYQISCIGKPKNVLQDAEMFKNIISTFRLL